VQTQDFWPNRSILSSHNLTTSSHRPLNIDLHPSVTQANPRRPIDVQKSHSPKARFFFVPVWAWPSTTSFGPGLARHDSSGQARAATSAQRATRHYFYRPARPLTPSRPHLPSALVKPYPFSLSLKVTAPNPTPILSRGAIHLQHSDPWRRRLAGLLHVFPLSGPEAGAAAAFVPRESQRWATGLPPFSWRRPTGPPFPQLRPARTPPFLAADRRRCCSISPLRQQAPMARNLSHKLIS
jgi:hypothetical protein